MSVLSLWATEVSPRLRESVERTSGLSYLRGKEAGMCIHQLPLVTGLGLLQGVNSLPISPTKLASAIEKASS